MKKIKEAFVKALITQVSTEQISFSRMVEIINEQIQPALTHWQPYDPNILETHPTAYGKYLICRKDGKIHWETWNGSGWAYNYESIRYWAVIVPPKHQ